MATNDTNKIVFFGSDEFSVGVLEQLKTNHLLPSLIITTAGKTRRGEISPSPVEVWAKNNKIESSYHLEPKTYNLFLVASFGKILPASILNLPTRGTLNIHPSLLPKYRGPSPIQSAILNGDAATGVSIMLLDEKMDHGPLLATRTYHLEPRTSFSELRDKLAKMGAELLAKILPDYLDAKIKPVEQDHSQATYTKKFEKSDAEIKLSDAPELNYRKVLALNPEPGAWLSDATGTRLKIITAHLEPAGGQTSCQLILDRVIPEGKKEMAYDDYLRGKE